MTRSQTAKVVQALIEAGRNVPPPRPQALQRTYAAASLALGASTVGASVGAAAAVTSGSQAAQGGAAVSALAAAKSSAVATLIGKHLAGGFLLGVVSVAAVQTGGHLAKETNSPQPSQTPNVLVSAAPVAPPIQAKRLANAHPAPAEAPSVRRAPPPTRAFPPVASRELDAEVELLDAARGAFAEKDTERARRWLAAYEGRFPHGQLQPEARLLKQRLSKLGPAGAGATDRPVE